MVGSVEVRSKVWWRAALGDGEAEPTGLNWVRSCTVDKDAVKRILSKHREELRTQFNVVSLRLFGSVVRGEATESSDIDLLVEFSDTPTLFTFLRLRGYLQELLEAKVDLVTESGLREHVKPEVNREAVVVA
jgi:predicted nucleotidyltransferase